MLETIVVLGGGYAGLTAAARLSEAGLEGSVTLVDAKPGFVERIRLHEIAAGSRPQDLDYRSFMASRGGLFVQGTATDIDTVEKAVTIRTTAGRSRTVGYDRLVYALGSSTDSGAALGVDRHADFLDTVPGTLAFREAVAGGGKVLIVGGGLTAIEAACELAERSPSLDVTLAAGKAFGPADEPGGLSVAGFDHVRATLDRLGIHVVSGRRVARLHAAEAVLDSGETLSFDRCIWAAGFRVPDLARRAGIAVNDSGQIVVDATLRSVSHPEIVAVGDAAEVVVEPAGKCRMSCAAGRPMGEAAARTILAAREPGAAEPFGFAYSFRCISLGRKDGLIQFVDRQDRPVEEVWTGERGARWKEYICRRTLAGIGFASDLGPPPDTPPRIA